jgi:hypothetical protein
MPQLQADPRVTLGSRPAWPTADSKDSINQLWIDKQNPIFRLRNMIFAILEVNSGQIILHQIFTGSGEVVYYYYVS